MNCKGVFESGQEVKVLNQPVLCPWTSSAPLQSTVGAKSSESCGFDGRQEDGGGGMECGGREEDVQRYSQVEADKTNESPAQEPLKQSPPNVKHSSSQFFHFLRLMQLFPNVHPATLHTVMTLCKNDFFVAVDKLLYAKRCKELYQNRRQLLQNFSNKSSRFTPYPCNAAYCQHNSCVKPQVIKLDTKKMVSRNRCTKMTDKTGAVNISSPNLSPVTIQCNVPMPPLSPVSPEDLTVGSSGNSNDVITVIDK